MNQSDENNNATFDLNSEIDNVYLNSDISREEILRNINKLKNGKVSGYICSCAK